MEKALAENQSSKGNEDEAPEEEGSRTMLVVEGGMERLEILRKFEEGTTKFPYAESTKERQISKERKAAASDILQLAHAGKVRAGKV